MAGLGSPCGACKFLRRKCIKGCVFAPYFCHEEGATHFAAIHKVFGASNVSKLLSHLPQSDRSEAAITISYEAQARLQDPIYGCVSHIFALQQQVVNLQAQLLSFKEQAARSCINGSTSANPSERLSCGNNKFPNPNNYTPNLESWVNLSQNSNTKPQFDLSGNFENINLYGQNEFANQNFTGINYEDLNIQEEKVTVSSAYEEGSYPMDSINARQWIFQNDANYLQSLAYEHNKL